MCQTPEFSCYFGTESKKKQSQLCNKYLQTSWYNNALEEDSYANKKKE